MNNLERLKWLRDRQSGIGGSDVAAILGLSKFNGPLEIYYSKINEITEDDLCEMNEFQYWGTKLEEMVAQRFCEDTGKKVRCSNQLHRKKNTPYLIASIDRKIVGENVGLECKTTSAYLDVEWIGDEIPIAYMLQCQHYMNVLGYDQWHIAVLIGGNKYVHKVIDRDNELIAEIESKLDKFWNNNVLQRVAPEPNHLDSEILIKLYSEKKGSTLTMASDVDALLDNVQEHEKQVKLLSELIETNKNKIKVRLGDNSLGLTDKYKVTWKEQKSLRVDSKRLKMEDPEIWQAYSKESVSRVFRYKEIK